MVNPINDLKLKTIEPEHRAKGPNHDNEGHVDAAQSLDSVNLSSESKQLKALKASLKNIPEVNDARVMYFKKEIEEGRYQVNSDNIAKKMLNNLEMV